MKKILSLTLIGSMLFLSGCKNNQDTGALTGAVVGGILGSTLGKGEGKVLATGIGAMAGMFLGSEIGKKLDEHDKLMMQNAQLKSLETSKTGHTTSWNNPDSGNRGEFIPTKTYQANNTYCREYTQNVYIGGELHKAYGTACRQPDGSWKIVK
jgi:surface antigen